MIDDFEQVLTAAQAGADWAVAVIFGAHHSMLLRYLRFQEPVAADDLAAETWLAVAERLGTFSGDEGALRAWLYTIALRRLADYRRRGARRRTSPKPPEFFIEQAAVSGPATGKSGRLPEDRAVARLTRGLPAEQAEIIALRVLGDLSIAEVAELLGKRPGAVRVAQHRALRHLASILTPDEVRAMFDA